MSGDGGAAAPWSTFAALIEITRPFTLVPPFLGILSGSLAAVGSQAHGRDDLGVGSVLVEHGARIVGGACMAALLNAASNVWNQVTERELDRLNKPDRPLPAGRLSVQEATVLAGLLCALALALAWHVGPPGGGRDPFVCAALAALLTFAYSTPPAYLKGRGIWANVAIAFPRGALLKLAGWGVVAPALASAEAWLIGLVFFLFLLGATSTKDFADEAGDRAAGVRTLVVRHGGEQVARWIAPAFVLPWLLLAAGVTIPLAGDGGALLGAAPGPMLVLVAMLVGYGAITARVLRTNLTAVARDANHPAWTHMYGMMMLAQAGLAFVYLV